jgi:hypothetical protein
MMRNTCAPVDCATSVEVFMLVLLVGAVIRADDHQYYDIGATILQYSALWMPLLVNPE